MSRRTKMEVVSRLGLGRERARLGACAVLLLSLCACDGTDLETAPDGGPGGQGGVGAEGGPGGAGGSGAGGAGGVGGGVGGVGGQGGEGGEVGTCVTLEDHFVDQAWPFMVNTCYLCHRAGGAAGFTRLQLVPPDNAEAIAADLSALRRVAAVDADAVSLLLAKPTLTHPDGHGGGQVLTPGSPRASVLAELVQRLNGERDACGVPVGGEPTEPVPGADCETAPAGRRTLRRLSHFEYARTMRDLTGLEVDASAVFAADRVVHGLDNQSEVLTVTGLLADQYRVLAEDLAARADLNRVLPCAATTRACAAEFIDTFGLKVFRRPLTGEEVGQYLAIFDLAAPDGFEVGIRWVLTALWQSPHFLYRTELGRRLPTGPAGEAGGEGGEGGEGGDTDQATAAAPFSLTSYEIASELSYLFWHTLPDDTLFAAAADGSLLDAEVVAREAERLLADPRSAETMDRLVNRWLGLDRLSSAPKDAAEYPSITPALREAMAEETSRFVRGLWTEGGGLRALLLDPHTWIDDTLAAHYGLPAPGGWQRVDVSNTPYGGILSQAAFLTTHAKPASSSPIHRGVVVRERLLCQPLPPPPANLDTSPPEVDPALSTRERYAQHSDDDNCAGCHRLIDPLGFAFEHFDGIGRHREMDGLHPVDASGAILGLPGDREVTVEGLRGLAEALADLPEVNTCYAEQWVRYGYGQGDTLPLECFAAVVEGQTTRLSDAPLALTRMAHFRWRSGGDTELDVPGVDRVPAFPGDLVAPTDPVTPVEEPPVPTEGATPGAMLTFTEDSRWATGYCVQGHVLNTTEAPLRWAVAHTIEGTINNLWNATSTATAGLALFRGADWNAEIGPGQTANFGFCAEL